MRIAHLLLGGEIRGGEMVALQLARAARRRGDDVLFLSPTRGPFAELVEREGMPVARADVARTFRVDGALRLARELRRRRVDILHTHTAIAGNVLGRIAARLAGVSVVSHLHIENHLPSRRARAAALRSVDNWTARLASRILVVSEDTRRALVRQGYPEPLMEVVPNSIDISVAHGDNGSGRTRVRRELGVADDAPLVGEIGRLCAVKGQRELLEALALLPDVHAAIVGADMEADGDFRADLERRAERLGLTSRVRFTGPRADVPAVLDALDVFVLPSWTEGMPITVLEAMAHGKPVVATAVGGTPELVADGETGVLVPPRDPERLAAAIRELLDDPEKARRLGEAGRERVASNFSEEAMTRRVLEVYDEVVSAR